MYMYKALVPDHRDRQFDLDDSMFRPVQLFLPPQLLLEQFLLISRELAQEQLFVLFFVVPLEAIHVQLSFELMEELVLEVHLLPLFFQRQLALAPVGLLLLGFPQEFGLGLLNLTQSIVVGRKYQLEVFLRLLRGSQNRLDLEIL